MVENVYISQLLSPYRGERKLIRYRQSTNDIMDEILREHARSSVEYDKVSDLFWKGDAEATGREVFRFLKSNVIYGVEPGGTQSVKTPAAIVAEGKTRGGDCKHYASFAVGIADSLRKKGYPISARYRFAAYNNSMQPGHVFAVYTDTATKSEWWLDPVLDSFDQRSPEFSYAIDKKPDMSAKIGELYGISGVPTTQDGGHWVEYIYRRPNMGWTDEPQMGRIRLRLGDALKKYNPALVPARNAFLGLVKLNFLQLAVKLNAAHKKNGGKVDKWWKKLGGNPNKLHTAFHQGVKHHNSMKHTKIALSGLPCGDLVSGSDPNGGGNYPNSIMVSGYEEQVMSGVNDYEMVSGYDWEELGFDSKTCRNMASVGFAPAAIPAMLAAAAPIIAMVKKLFTDLGVKSNTDKMDRATELADHDVAETHNADDADVDADGSVNHGKGIKTKVKDRPDGKQDVDMEVPEDGGGAEERQKGDRNIDAENGSVTAKAWDWIRDHKMVVGGVVAAAVVIPIILHSRSGKKHR